MLAASCGGGDGGGTTDEETAGAAGASLLSVTPVRPPDFYRQERGAGVVFAGDAFLGGPSGSDTVTVLAAPDEPTVRARFILDRDSLSWGYRLEAREPAAEGAALEYGYEEWGLPVLPRGPGNAPGWVEVRYATGLGGEPLTGWVRLAAPLEMLSWSERLAESPLFLLEPDSIGFHPSPDDPAALLELAPDDSREGFDYILHPLESRGSWMRVEVVTPSDYCFDPPAPRRDTMWIRHLDPTGRPRVWYYTRGC
jgi:hypothetical protein